jgi:hypothetical protein
MRRRKRGVGVVKAFDVAVDDDGDRYRRLDGAHRRPVGAAFVELAAGAAMHRDKPHAGLFRSPGEIGGVARKIVPAKPHFQRHRNTHRLHHRLDQSERMIEVAHQRRTRRAVGDVLCRAAHIDVDNIGAGIFGDARAFRHPARFATGQLDDMQSRAMILDAPVRVALAVRQRGRCCHFGDHQAGAQARGQASERSIGHAGHRRQKHRIWRRDWADGEALHGVLMPPIHAGK